MRGKTHLSALAIVPPEEMWEPIQQIRRAHDRQVQRWMPHINVLYPFRPRAQFPAAGVALAVACGEMSPLHVMLGEFRFFRHASGRCTLWLAPEPMEELQRLQAAVQVVFPDCDDLAQFAAGYTPHLSVGQCRTSAECHRLRKVLQANWQPITFRLTELALLAREQDGPFAIIQRLPFDHARA